MGAPRISHYDWSGGREAMLRFGPDTGPVAILALPLFEEANRTRTFAVRLLRELGTRGVAGALPDLPGQGESVVPLEEVSLADMQAASAAAASAAGARYVIGIRSGALLAGDASVAGHWHLSPQDGASLVRELSRIARHLRAPILDPGLRRGTADVGERVADPPVTTLPPRGAAKYPGERRGPGGSGPRVDTIARSAVVEVAGNLVSQSFLETLSNQAPPAARTIRLSSDPAPADRTIDAAPLWRRAEPGDDPALAALLADDIAAWIATCAG